MGVSLARAPDPSAMKRLRTLLPLLALIPLGCSDATEPEIVPPLLYLPGESQLQVQYGQALRFEVRTTKGEPYPVEFEIVGDTTATAPVLEWRVRRVGEISVAATARAGNSSRTHSWTLDARIDGLDPLGPVRLFEVTRLPVEGALRAAWLAPRGEFGDPPVEFYELALSTDPISIAEFPYHVAEEVPHRSGVDSYRFEFRGLEAGREYYLRVRAVDAIGRHGELSELRSAIAPHYFPLSGRVEALDAFYDDPLPIAGARVRLQEMESVSGVDGGYDFPAVLDYFPITLELVPPVQSPAFYPLERVLKSEFEPLHDYLLIPRGELMMNTGTPGPWDFLLVLRTLTGQLSNTTRVSHWESYPVLVEVKEHTLDNGVDYALALRRGIDKWNAAVGFEVLRESPVPPSVGTVTRYDLPTQGGGVLGEVTMLEPAGGSLFLTVPRKLSFGLIDWFASQDLIDRVAIHELGHVLYLAHSPSKDHVMSAGVSLSSPNEVHPDEAIILRTLMHTPNGTGYSWYQSSP